VCVDLDGVLAHWDGSFDPVEFGPMILGADIFTHELSKKFRVLIHTARISQEVAHPHSLGFVKQHVIDWLTNNSIAFDDVWEGKGKPVAVMYVDDRAHSCRPQDDGADAFKHILQKADEEAEK